jgi:hypothetical protein
MKTHNNIYEKIYSKKNLIFAWRKARKKKTKKDYVIEFEEDLVNNINNLHNELKNKTYFPRALENFIVRDPKTRKISKSHFRDRVIHHATNSNSFSLSTSSILEYLIIFPCFFANSRILAKSSPSVSGIITFSTTTT